MPAHSERYLKRVDAHLKTLNKTARREFLTRQINTWERRYSSFLTDDSPLIPSTTYPDAADYLLTIAGLAVRME
jgi:hypothetical protein